ncbi:hypothetical protein D3C76_1225920 [compost metagenome]
MLDQMHSLFLPSLLVQYANRICIKGEFRLFSKIVKKAAILEVGDPGLKSNFNAGRNAFIRQKFEKIVDCYCIAIDCFRGRVRGASAYSLLLSKYLPVADLHVGDMNVIVAWLY